MSTADPSNNAASGPTGPDGGRRLLGQGGTVVFYTALSRVSGFARDVVIAFFFGASGAADAFFVAFKIPNFFRRLFAEGAFSQGFVPVLAEYRETRDLAEVRALVARVAGNLGLVLAVLTLLGVTAAPWVAMLFAPGFHDDPQRLALAADMLRLTFPYLLLISLVALCAGVLNTWGRFAVPAATPILLNLALIAAALGLHGLLDPPIMALAWGVLAAGLLQLLVQLPAMARIGLLPMPRVDWRHPGVRRVLQLMLPATFGASVSQVNLLIDTLLASFLVTGSISWLYYADRLVELPVGLFAIALGTVILPALSRAHARNDRDGFQATLAWALRVALVLGLPATVALYLLAPALVSTVFQYGVLGPADVMMAAVALQAYAVGLPGFMLVRVLAPGYFGRQDTRTPVRIALLAMFVNLGLNLALIGPMGHAGLALATAVAATTNAGLLFGGLVRGGHLRLDRALGAFALRCAAAAGLLGVGLSLLAPPTAWWLVADVLDRGLAMAAICALGGASYALALLVFGVRPAHLSRSGGAG